MKLPLFLWAHSTWSVSLFLVWETSMQHKFQPTSLISSLRIFFSRHLFLSVFLSLTALPNTHPDSPPSSPSQSDHPSVCKPYVMEGSCENQGEGSHHAPVAGHPTFPLISAGLCFFFSFCTSLPLFFLLPFCTFPPDFLLVPSVSLTPPWL